MAFICVVRGGVLRGCGKQLPVAIIALVASTWWDYQYH